MKKNLRDTHTHYKKNSEKPVGYTTYRDINLEFHKFLIKKVLEGFEITLPERLGTLSIRGKKQEIKVGEDGKITGLAPDWVKTKQLWDRNPEAKKEKKLVYHMNRHSDNIRYKYFWSKNRVLIRNKILYSLRMARQNKRAVNQLIMAGKQYKTKN